MSVLVDTNVLLRSVQPSHPMHDPAVRTVAAFIRDGQPVVITPQVVAEFWNVATRPVAHNGLGWSHQQALDEVVRIEGFLSLVIEPMIEPREFEGKRAFYYLPICRLGSPV